MSVFQIQVIQTVIFLLGLMGVAFAGWQLFSWIRWNRVQILLTLDGRWEKEPIVQARKKIFTKIGEIENDLKSRKVPQMDIVKQTPQEFHTYLARLKQSSLDDYLVYMSVPNFFETVGAIAHREDACKLWGGTIIVYYEWFKTHIERRREDEKAPNMYIHFSDLAKWCKDKSSAKVR